MTSCWIKPMIYIGFEDDHNGVWIGTDGDKGYGGGRGGGSEITPGDGFGDGFDAHGNGDGGSDVQHGGIFHRNEDDIIADHTFELKLVPKKLQ